MARDEFVIWASESDYDTFEASLAQARIDYKRSTLTRFSIDPVAATIVTIIAANAIIKPLARVLADYLKERKRRIAIKKSDGSTLFAENYNVEEVERLLRSSLIESDGHVYIEPPADGESPAPKNE